MAETVLDLVTRDPFPSSLACRPQSRASLLQMAAASPTLLRPSLLIVHYSPLQLDHCPRLLFPTAFTGLRQSRLLFRHKPFSPISSRRPVALKAAQSNVIKVIQTAWRIGKDSVDAGTNFVPGSIPRPVARIGVTGALAALTLFLFSSILSTAFFVLALMGVVYFLYLVFNSDEGPKGGGGGSLSEDKTLEEARRIMDKYK